MVQELYAPNGLVESRRKIVGFKQSDLPSSDWAEQSRRAIQKDHFRFNQVVVAVRGERLALARLVISSADVSPGAPRDEILQLYGLDEDGRIALQMWFDVEDIDAAIAELDAIHARFEQEQPKPRRLENAATRANARVSELFADSCWDEIGALFADNLLLDDRRRGLRRESNDPATEVANLREVAALGIVRISNKPLALRGDHLALGDATFHGRDGFGGETLAITEVDSDGLILAMIAFDLDDFDSAIAELEARYLAGEAAVYQHTWSMIAQSFASASRHELPAMTPDGVTIDHRRAAAFAPGEGSAYFHASWELAADLHVYIEAVHRLSDLGAVFTHVGTGTSRDGFEAEWRTVDINTVEGDFISRGELFDESDLDAALARFEQLSHPVPRLENTATRVFERIWPAFTAHDWEAVAEDLADDVSIDDRRRVVSVGIRHGRDAMMEDLQVVAGVGFTITMVGVIATRGERLALTRVRAAGSDPEAIQNDALNIVGIDADERITTSVVFDLDDFEAAIAELEARYLAGEGAAHVRTWSVIAGFFAAHNRGEVAVTTPDVVTIDHRRAAAFAPGEGIEYIRAGWELDQSLDIYVEKAHRVNDLGAIFTVVGHGTSREGFKAEWRAVTLMTAEGEMLSRMEVFDEGDLDVAIAKFDELSHPAPTLENSATRTYERMWQYFEARDWAAIIAMVAEDELIDDRRRVVNGGLRHGRDAGVEEMRAAADIGFTITVVAVRAIRGDRLALARVRAAGHDPAAIQNDVLQVVQIDSDERIAVVITFDIDDFEAALAELDARYVVGEGAAHAPTWSVITGALVAHNRRQVAASTPDVVSIDHRRVASFAPGEGIEYIRAGWDLDINLNIYIETPHRVNDLGAVFTWAGYGTSHQGFDAEWRGVEIMTVDGDLLSRAEVFDESDLDTALAKFDQLCRPVPRLENAASQVYERFLGCFASRDWDAMAEILDDEVCIDDRRRIANAGTRFGRDAEIEDSKAAAHVGFTNLTPTIIATRGARLILSRTQAIGHDPEAIRIEVLHLIEIDTDERIAALVVFELDDLDAALEELDARYLAGEAAAYASTWSVLATTCTAFNQHELPATTPDSVYVDHRPVLTVEAADLPGYLRGVWDQTPDSRIYVEAVHRLSHNGAVVTHAVRGTSPEGFNAEWRMIDLLTVEDSRISRCEVFEEADLEGALARFEQLSPPTPRLENTATRVFECLYSYILADDWHAVAQITAENVCVDDRRRVVNAGILHGRDANIKDAQATIAVGFTMKTVGTLAIRGARLALTRVRVSGRDPEAIQNDALSVIEINTEERIVAVVVFDLDDTDAAFAELDARYLAGEAAPYAQTWSVVASSFAAFNRHEVLSADWVIIDHRRGTPFESSTMTTSIHRIWDLTPDLSIHIEAVHRLNNSGAVITHEGLATSQEGFDAEWRAIDVLMVEDELITRCEIFDEADLDAALTRFEELSPGSPRLQNAASQVLERVFTYFATRNWIALADVVAEDIYSEDRRSVVNAGVRHGRDAEIADMRAIADVGVKHIMATAVATRGEHLALSHVLLPIEDQGAESFRSEALCLVKINADNRVSARLLFDLDDIDAAFEELESRYLAGEAAAHSHTWSVIAGIYAGFTPHEYPPMTPDSVLVDHRPVQRIETVDLATMARSVWDSTPDARLHIDAVHRISGLGAVFTLTAGGTTPEGFEAEWRMIEILTLDGDSIHRLEIFDEADLDAALACFEELQPRSPQLKSAVAERFLTHFATRDWDAMAQDFAENYYFDDRRRVINAGVYRGRDAAIKDLRVATDIGLTTNASVDIIASRGERRILTHWRASGPDPAAVQFDVLQVLEFDTDERVAAAVIFDLDDIDTAFAELDARYLAGEAAPYAHTWSAITDTYAAFNRHDLTGADWAVVDHRRGALFVSSNMIATVRAFWDQTPDLRIRIEAVHRISGFGAVVTHTAHGTSPEGFDAEWRMIQVLTLEGDRIGGCELFDETDLDAALARFDELQPYPRQAANAASQVEQRFLASFAARDWDAIAEMFAEDILLDDRRHLVNAGTRRGRDAEIANMRAVADVGVTNMTSTVIATRGERLVLGRYFIEDSWSGSTALCVSEIDAENQVLARVIFDADDFDAAIAELDARYAAGEAAAHAHRWSVIADTQAGVNRREVPATTPDSVYIDHRPLVSIEGVDLAASLRAMWDITSAFSAYIEAVHRLDELGVVVTQVVHATMQEGLDAELRYTEIVTFEGDLLSRVECFDEADLDTALARFDALHQQARPLENAASRVFERLLAHYLAREWDAVSKMLAENIFNDDRRRVVSAGVRRGRDATIASMRASADLGLSSWVSMVIATRGEHLALSSDRISVRDEESEVVVAEVLGVVEIDADERIVTRLALDLDDFDAAMAELDARYVAGGAAPYADTWSVITGIQAAVNRRELPPMTPNPGYIDHRPLVSIEGADLAASIRAVFELFSAYRVYVEEVHRLDELGAVYTQVHKGTSNDGVDAELRMIEVQTVEGGLLSRAEVFDEADLDVALARFEELHPQAPRLENAASRLYDRSNTYLAARNWDAIAKLLADDVSTDDRRRVVGGGIQHGRDAQIANMRAVADLGVKNIQSVVIATRGERLALTRTRVSGGDRDSEAFSVEMLNIVEIDADNRFTSAIQFDPDDIDAAFDELEARYVAGEAAGHAQTWSVIAAAHAAFNRHELPATTSNHVYIDHRPLVSIEGVDLAASLHALWEITSAASTYVEAVHRLDQLGAVATQVLKATTQDGVDAELRIIEMFIVEGDLYSRVEIFDEADTDAALARFDELHTQAPRLENAASRTYARLWKHFMARNWAAVAETISHGIVDEDGRRLVGHGIRRGRDAELENLRVTAELGITSVTPTVIATRGERLALHRVQLSGPDQQPGAFFNPVLRVVGTDADERIVVAVLFDIVDIDAAFEELDARYLAGEAAAHAQTWTAMTRVQAAYNRHEFLPTTDNWVNIDHRRGRAFAPGDMIAYIRTTYDIAPNIKGHIEAVHRLSSLGAVITEVVTGTSQEGFDFELREVALFAFDGDKVCRFEMFDEEDFATALARFDELARPAPPLENAATRIRASIAEAFNLRDVEGLLALATDDARYDDRRRGLRDEGLASRPELVRGIFEAPKGWRLEVAPLAIRGSRLALTRDQYRDIKEVDRPITNEHLMLTELSADGLVNISVIFDPDDINAALDELDARYLVGEAAAHAHTWSVIASTTAALNRHELPSADWVVIDHRRGTPFAPRSGGDTNIYASIGAIWDLMPNLSIYIEAAHRLSNRGAVVTWKGHGISQEGFEAEWRMIQVPIVKGDLIQCCELFDETDLDAALARLDELDRQAASPLENASTRTWVRLVDAYNRRDMSGFLALMTEDTRLEDRRKGLRATLDGLAVWKNVQILFQADISWRLSIDPIAIRGSHLSLTRHRIRDIDETDQPITWEALCVMEVDENNLMRGQVVFDPDEIDGALEELDARYLIGEAAAHSHTWSVVAQAYVALSRGELPATTPDCVNIDHRRGIAFGSEVLPYVRAIWDVTPDFKTHIEVVHRLTDLGALVTWASHGTSQEGFDAEWRGITLSTLEGDQINRCEMFDETDLGAALARFDELDRPPLTQT
ncbi:nuclear transport factor 2 family protein [Mycobacterium sp. 1165178.9]|uniref:nuclear transport factor 2 family protein n=1 Tax=Mycobacterium sp. 1165178.9 TaxID=1834070 RepID=UPI0018D31058|nr:nuclear transport factor 2 family protein [Mycobacterium sp. 1165178.9]